MVVAAGGGAGAGSVALVSAGAGAGVGFFAFTLAFAFGAGAVWASAVPEARLTMAARQSERSMPSSLGRETKSPTDRGGASSTRSPRGSRRGCQGNPREEHPDRTIVHFVQNSQKGTGGIVYTVYTHEKPLLPGPRLLGNFFAFSPGRLSIKP